MADSPPISPKRLQTPRGCLHVRCAECFAILMVGPGMTQFICPKCQLAQRLPPEMVPLVGPVIPSGPVLPPPVNRRPQPRAEGIDPSKLQIPCANCKAILNVPHGLTRFKCPQCDSDLLIQNGQHPPTPPLPYKPPGIPLPGNVPILPLPGAAPPEPEEINEVGSDNEVSCVDSVQKNGVKLD